MSSGVGNVEQKEKSDFFLKSSSGAIKIQLHKVAIDRGMSWDQAFSAYNKSLTENMSDTKDVGFYVTTQVRHSSQIAFILLIFSKSLETYD